MKKFSVEEIKGAGWSILLRVLEAVVYGFLFGAGAAVGAMVVWSL